MSNLDRRSAVLGLSAAALLTGCATTQSAAHDRPLVIAHRGASGERPEHTADAYRLALDQGADFIEPDLVSTKDGVLICRHENEISATTDVGTIPKFAGRKLTKNVDGRPVTGWFAEDLTAAEIAEIAARERLADLRPLNDRANGYQAIPTFQEVIDLAKQQSRRLGRPVGVYPELKHPTHLKALGHDLGEMVLAALSKNGLPSPDVPVFIQCFEAEPLRALKGRTQASLVRLTSDAADVTPAGIAAVAQYATGLGAEKSIVTADVVCAAHAAGLKVHTWTFRAENNFLPAEFKRGTDRAAHGDMKGEVSRYLDMGVDGVFSDFPGLAVEARDAWVARRG